MSWLRMLAVEVLGLFVDDGSFAAALLVWLGVVWLVVQRSGRHGGWVALALFAGLAAVLVESATRYARRRKQ